MGFFSELPWKTGLRETNIDKALLSLVPALNPFGNSTFFNYIREELLQLISSNIGTINKGLYLISYKQQSYQNIYFLSRYNFIISTLKNNLILKLSKLT